MANPNVVSLYNRGTNDTANTGAASGDTNFVPIDRANDKLLFLDGAQMDGDASTAGRQPVVIPASGSLEAPKTFVYDHSLTGTEYQQVPLAGTTAGGQNGGNTRYVFAIYFDGATATVPYLEAWDDNTHASTSSAFLGGGTPANSTLKAVSTTGGAPGSATWAGTALAGTASRIALDAAALSAAKNLYFNIKQVIADTFLPQSDDSIVLTLRYSYS